MDHDRVQLNVLDYDPDIDGPQLPTSHVNTAVVSVWDHLTFSDSQILDVAELEAENHSTEESSNPIYNHFKVSHGNEDIPSGLQDPITTAHQDTTQYNAHADEIPELEDWDNQQFDDAASTLINHHNTHSESKQI